MTMGRRIIYTIQQQPENIVTESEWSELQRLQHWYNSEFIWSGGKILFKRYVIFPNTEQFSDFESSIGEIIRQRRQSLVQQGFTELEIVAQLQKDGLISVKWGGYFDGCIASGFTRVADNEWNAYLVCDFLLKASLILAHATITVQDEGKFIKVKKVFFKQGEVIIPPEFSRQASVRELVETNHLFSIVDPEKYDKHPMFNNVVPEFQALNARERRELLRQWNWLGYDDSYDEHGDDRKGFNLNLKVRKYHLSPPDSCISIDS
jgi:hypothetical protein